MCELNINYFYFRSKTLEVELEKCRSEINSLEKELSDALQNNLLELASRSSGYIRCICFINISQNFL